LNTAADLGIVVIGRNEATRLDACFDALPCAATPMVYVDSGSNDDSPEIAERRGVRVIRLSTGPYTAARGRQIGFEDLCMRYPGLQYVQFVDGDCILASGWIERAAAFLTGHAQAAVVTGRLRERRAGASLLIRLVDVEWDLPIGEIDAVGGISLARVAAIRDVGGWLTELVAGEELDLSARLRARGWQLFRLPDDMALHDIGIRAFGELWRRAVRAGFSYAQLALRHGAHGYRRWARRAVGNVAYGALLPLLALTLLAVWRPGAVIVALVYVVLVLRIAWGRIRRGDAPPFALLYGVVLTVCKVAAAIGTFQLLLTRVSGRRARLIEYKSSPAPGGH
jgi:GT2 family glycosyltransferase